jgi:Domain of unknown function (DUF932)
MFQKSLAPLSNYEIRKAAPSVFADHPAERVSDKFAFMPTIEVVESLRVAGWQPVMACESKTRSDDRRGFQKHMLRLRHADQELMRVDDSLAELVLTNAHDGSSAYALHAGIFRLVCSNGLVVSDGTFERISVRHQGFKTDDVIDASFQVLSEVPKLKEHVRSMRSLQLTAGEQTAFAEAALVAKYGDEPAPIGAEQLLRARRIEDNKPDLWSTMNRVQESLIRGGLRGRNPNTKKRVTTREVKGIDGNINLNKAIWRLAEEMKSHKAR